MTSCLHCGEPLRLVAGLTRRGIPHGSAPAEVLADLDEGEHNVQFDYKVVYACDACGLGDLRTHSHDCFQPPWEEDWDMTWSSQIPAADLAILTEGLAGCEDPARFACPCPAHERLRESCPLPAGTRIPDWSALRPFPRMEVGVGRGKAGLPEFQRGRVS